jgi:hypothetical protein
VDATRFTSHGLESLNPKSEINTNPAVVEDFSWFIDACASYVQVQVSVSIHELPGAGHNSMIARPHRKFCVNNPVQVKNPSL